MRTIAVLGGGNGAHAAAADLSMRGFSVRFFSLFSKELQPVRQQGGISLVNDQGERLIAIHRVCESVAEAMEGADAILIVVPAQAHEAYAQACSPHLKKGQFIVLIPGSTGGALVFKRILREKGAEVDVPICETNTLTYICRLIGPAKVKITARSETLFATLPGRNISSCFPIYKELFPATVDRKNVLETSLTNLNAVIHPPGMIMNAGWIEFTKGDFAYYCDGTTPAVAQAMEEIDRERLGLCKKVNYSSLRFLDHFYKAGGTTEEARQSGSVYQAFQESEPNRFIRAPQDLSYRFLTEDVPYGIVPMAHLGEMLGVATPTIDALIELASLISQTDYRQTGWTLEKMGIRGMTLGEVLKYVEQG